MPAHVSEREYQALAEVRYRIRGLLAFSEAAAREAGVEPQHHQLLLAIRGLPAGELPTIKTIAERLHVHHNSAVELAGRAEASGLIARAPSERDRREVTLRLTPRGARVLESLSRAHRKQFADAEVHLVRALRTLAARRPGVRRAS